MKRRCPAVAKEDETDPQDQILSESTEVCTVVDDVNRNVVSVELIDDPSTDEQSYPEVPCDTEASIILGQRKRCKTLAGETVQTMAESSPIAEQNVNSRGSESETPKCITEKCHAVKSSDKNDVESRIESAIMDLATQRGSQKTFCPSEIPRLILKFPNWRDYMDLTRSVAFRMANSGIVDVMQKGVVRTASEYETLRGPMRIRLSP
jgi:Protein of unknown function (DUF3253)